MNTDAILQAVELAPLFCFGAMLVLCAVVLGGALLRTVRRMLRGEEE